MYRWFSGKYDSVKQKFVSIKYDPARSDAKDDLLRMYTASLRNEMLFYGMVVVTDSQWYDGRYFARLTEHKTEFDLFKDLVSDVDMPLFQIKRDPFYFERIFSNEFEFSSLPGDGAAPSPQVVYLKDFAKRNKERIIAANGCFTKYFDLLRNDVPSEFSFDFDLFETHITSLDRMPDTVFSNWTPSVSGPSYIHLVFNGVRTDGTGRTNIQYIVETYLAHWCDDAYGEDFTELSECKTKIEKLLLEENPNRTAIKEQIDRSKKKRDYPIYDDLLNFLNFLYNNAFARQHQCDLFDAVEIGEMLVRDKDIEIRAMSLPIEFFYCISKASWEEFSAFLHIPKIRAARNAWLAQYKVCQNNPNPDERERALEKLEKYMDEIKTIFYGESLGINKEEYAFDVETGQILIAGSSSTDILTDNESCCFFAGVKHDEIRRCTFTVEHEPEDFHLGTISAQTDSFTTS